MESYKIQDLIDVQQLAQIQDSMAKAIGFAAVITGPDGKPITHLSNFSKACEMFHRPLAGTLCEASDKTLGKESLEQGGVVIRQCDHAGLMDGAVAITIDGRPIGIFLCGQVFFEPPKEELYRQKAKELGIDEEAYLNAIKEVPIVPRERFEAGVELMRQTASMLAEAGRKSLDHQNVIEALKKTQTKMELLLELSPVAICEWRPGGELLSINKQFARMVGYTVEEVYAMGWKNLTAPEYQGDPDRLHEENALKGIDKTYQKEYIHKDGHRVPIHLVTEPIFKQDGTVDYYISYIQDFTEIKNAQENAERLKAFYETIIELSANGIATVSPDGRIRTANKALRDMLGIQDQELGSVFDWINPEHHQEHRQWIENILQKGHGTCPGHDTTVRTKDGRTFNVLLNHGFTHFPEGNTPCVIFYVKDITEIKYAQAKLEELVEAQQQTIKELSTPIIPVWTKVLMAPLLGSFDSMRMHDLSERLLEEVASKKPRAVLLDLSGLAHVDTQVVSEILRLVTSVKLLGSRTILSGISPVVAQSLVRIGATLDGAPTYATLEQALRNVVGEVGHAKL